MRQYRGALSDPNLIKNPQRIIGQETHHAFNFTNWTQEMAKYYPDLIDLDKTTKSISTGLVNVITHVSK